MYNVTKASWLTENDNMRFSMPITKVDKERRIVSGFATLDNVDRQGDIVPLDASMKAFENFRGNIREMHQPKAVGKIVSFKSDKYFNKDDEKFYNGVYVSAYISRGAQDTWEKVIDGTLSGFSIGGSIKDSEDHYDNKVDKSVRVIKDYDLTELSLVDNPANQFANILSIQKDVSTKIESVEKVDLENVFWCENDDIISLNSGSPISCPVCEIAMKNIGFVETNDNEKISVIKSLLKSFNMSSANNASDSGMGTDTDVSKNNNAVVDDQAKSIAENIAKEGNIVAEEVVKSSEEPVDEVVEESVELEEAEEVIEKSEEAAAPVIESEELDLAKAIDDLKASIAESASANAEQISEITSLVKSLTEALGAVSGKIKSIEEGLDGFGKRVDAVEADTAVRKSGDLGGIVQLEENKVEKSVWGGRFLSTADLYR
jgi:hypothetical protein